LSLWMKSYGVTIQMKATEQYFPVVLFIMLYKVVPTFESVDEILWCDQSNESYCPLTRFLRDITLTSPGHHTRKEFCERDERFPVWADEW